MYIVCSLVVIYQLLVCCKNNNNNNNSIPLVVKTYGCWGAAAVAAFSKVAGLLSTKLNQPKSKTIFGIYTAA